MLNIIFYHLDNFCKQFEHQFNYNLLSDGNMKRKREFSMSLSEIMTIMAFYHHSGYKNFKDYYTKHVEINMQKDFKKLVSYNRFLELRGKALPALFLFLNLEGLGKCTGISVIDSFCLPVCHNKRIYSHKTLKGIAKHGKTSVGWFYGFKVHVIINHLGEIIAFNITSGNVSDNIEYYKHETPPMNRSILFGIFGECLMIGVVVVVNGVMIPFELLHLYSEYLKCGNDL